MGLNIKNAHVHDLARQAAAVTGTSQTAAIEEALTRLLADFEIDPDQRHVTAKVDRVQSIVRAYMDTPSGDRRGIDTVEDLFDDRTGLPR